MWWNNTQKEKGITLYLAIVALALLLGIALGVGSVFVGGSRLLRGVGHSVVALSAAEAGIEKVLYDDRPGSGIDIVAVCAGPGGCTGTLSNGATYRVVVTGAGLVMPDGTICAGVAYCAESAGTFQNSSRKVQIER